MNVTSVAEALYLAAENSSAAREMIKSHEARETVREVRRQQAAWWRWRNNQQPTKA